MNIGYLVLYDYVDQLQLNLATLYLLALAEVLL